MGSIPCASNASQVLGEKERFTAKILWERPAASDARRAIRAREGPIFPPAPKIIRPPSTRDMLSITPSVGRLRNSSSWSSESMTSGVIASTARGMAEENIISILVQGNAGAGRHARARRGQGAVTFPFASVYLGNSCNKREFIEAFHMP